MRHFKRFLTIILSINLLILTAVFPANAQSDMDISTIISYIGNTSANIINGGVMAFYGDRMYFSDELNNGALCYIDNDMEDKITLSDDMSNNINISSDGATIFYSTEGNLIKKIYNNQSSTILYQTEKDITQMYLVNDKLLYYLSDGHVYCYDIENENNTMIYGKDRVTGFIPNRYGIIYITGDLFDYTLYANERFIADKVLTYYTEDDVLVLEKKDNTYTIKLEDAFKSETIEFNEYQFEEDDEDNISLFSEADYIEENIDDATIVDPKLALNYEASDVSFPVELSASSGVQNVVKRARQQVEIKWKPKKNVKGYSSNTSGAATTFKAGTEYKGIPYGQQVDAGVYVPHSYSLNKFISAVNNKDSKFYTSRGKYSVGKKDSPYYASDCSAFVSWCYGLGRMTTTSIGKSSKIKKVSSQSVYSAKIGDCLNKSGSHVVLITDLIYSGGKLSKVTIMEQTPPKAKKTTYSVSTITSSYLNKGYVLRRYSDIDSVKYEHSCAVPLDGEYCSSCNPKPSKPVISNCGATSDSSIKIEWKKVDGANKYKIVRHEVDGANKKTLTSSCTSTSYTDKGLTPGHTYYYVVYAGSSSDKWSDASKEWKTYTKPKTPDQPEVNRDVPNQLTITWNKVSGAHKYKLEYHRADSSGWITLDSNIQTTSYTHKKLDNGTKYNYRVTAIREGEIGPSGGKKKTQVKSEPSPTKTKFTQMARPVNKTNDNTSQVILSWAAVKGTKGYSYTYNVWRDGVKINSKEITGTTYTDTTAVSGKIHKYQIQVIENAAGWKEPADRGKNAAIYAGSKIAKEISVTPQSKTEMKIGWSVPVSAPSGTKYTLWKYNAGGKKYEILKSNITGTNYVDKGLKAGETYQYYIDVCDASGNYLTSTFSKSAVLNIAPAQITLDKTSVSLTEGDTVKLTATVSPDNAFDKTVNWESSNDGTAMVDTNGTVTAKTAGTATITATASNGKRAECIITVNSAKCTHEYDGDNDGWVIDKDASCEESGSRHRTCTKCSETETETIEATGHKYSAEYQTVKEATCTEAGEQAHVCSVCNAQIDNIPIEATGHRFGDTWLVEEEATCNTTGIEYRQCSECGEKEKRDTDTTTHNYELTEQTDVTPDGPGHRTYTCTICRESYTEEYVPEVNAGTIAIGEGSLKSGGTVTVPVTIDDNPGIAGFNFTLNYDKDVMTPVSITKGALIQQGTFTSNLEQGVPATELKEVSVYWGNDTNITEDGELFNITFEVTSGMEQGLYPISLNYEKGDITDAAFNDVMPSIIDNAITIADVMRGDVNLDRRVDSQDELLLSRYIAKWNVEFNESQKKAANVFGDSAGQINSKDGVRLSQILSGYELVESPISVMSVKEVNISVDDVASTTGGYISVPVRISENEGIAGFNLTLNYDREYLTPVAIEKGDMLVDGSFTSNLTDETDGESLDYVTAYWNCAYDMAENGELFTVDFVLKDNAEVGQQLPIEISCEEGNLCDHTLNDVNANISQSTLDIIEMEPEIEGDLPLMPYYISGGEIKSSTGDMYESIPTYGDFDLNVTFTTVEYEDVSEMLPATIFVGVYDESGGLISVMTQDVAEDILTDGLCRFHIDETANSISNIKVFIWDGDMKPLALPFSVIEV